MPDKIKLLAIDTNTEKEYDKDHALEILRRDALRANGNPKKRNWKRVSSETESEKLKESESDSKPESDNRSHRKAKKSGDPGEG